jgi:hypothetical protein
MKPDIGDYNPDTSLIFDEFSYTYTVLIVFVMLWLITLKKDLTVFVRMNTFGVVFTVIIIFFILAIGGMSLFDE